ncbi:MAG TPA: MOSC domain-containing protein [Pyrinomonadaceae bacterium]|nr:MOSC domain-containing protein [Pyrinomonadaceae bacterium]
MKLVSLNVSLPRMVEYNGEPVATGIFKEPVNGPVMLRTLNLDGDRQADLSVHGGPDKAVYGYPAEHYDFWRNELPDMKLPYGMFGENFTLDMEGMLEASVNVGDCFRVGEVELIVTQPRLPCYKLGIKFGRVDIIKRFLQSRRTGFYFAVKKEGQVTAGDELKLVSRDANNITIADIVRLYAFAKDDFATMRRAIEVPALPESWRAYFEKRLPEPGR